MKFTSKGCTQYREVVHWARMVRACKTNLGAAILSFYIISTVYQPDHVTICYNMIQYFPIHKYLGSASQSDCHQFLSSLACRSRLSVSRFVLRFLWNPTVLESFIMFIFSKWLKRLPAKQEHGRCSTPAASLSLQLFEKKVPGGPGIVSAP